MSIANARRLRELVTASWAAQCIYVVAKLGIADRIAAGTHEVGALAAATQANPDALRRVLRAAAGAGVLAEPQPGRFALTPLGESLRSDVPDSMRHLTIWYGGEVFRAYADLLHAVTTGGPTFPRIFGMDLWRYFATHPEANETFNLGMGTVRWQDQRPLVAAYDFSGLRRIVDVGGGEGTMLAAILHAHPAATGVLVDLPHAIAGAHRHLADAGVEGRCELVSGSAYDPLPTGGDAYILSSVLHFMNDAQALAALARVRAAITPGGRLLIVERVIPAGDDPHFGKLLDVTMLVMMGGRERTEAEFRDLLGRAGFVFSRVVPLPDFVAGIDLGVVEAVAGPVAAAPPSTVPAARDEPGFVTPSATSPR